MLFLSHSGYKYSTNRCESIVTWFVDKYLPRHKISVHVDHKGLLINDPLIMKISDKVWRICIADSDVLLFAKGIAGGVPMGVTMVRPDILDCINKGEHSSTFGGNPLSCAAGIATLQSLTQDGLIENAESMGKLFREGLNALKEKHTIIREIRGKGLMIGVELKFEVRDILMEGIENGLLLLYSGRNILRLLPPLVISESDIKKSLEILDQLLTNEEKRRNG